MNATNNSLCHDGCYRPAPAIDLVGSARPNKIFVVGGGLELQEMQAVNFESRGVRGQLQAGVFQAVKLTVD